MDIYQDELDTSCLGADMKTYQRAPAFLENSLMYKDVGLLMSDVFHGMFNLDLTPRRHLLSTVKDAFKKSPIKMKQLVGLGLAAVRAL